MKRLATASAGVALVTVVWFVLFHFWYPRDQLTDFPTYTKYGYLMWRQHAVPYRDFRLEYPPAALPTFLVPAALHDLGFRKVFEGLMAACLAGSVLCTLAVGGRRAAALAAVCPLLIGSVILSRFDLWPAFLAVAALAALLRGRLTWSAVALGTGFAAKLWPAVLAPFLFVHLWRTKGRRAAWEWLGLSAATAAAWFLPFVVVSPGGVAHSFYRQLFRPLQIESTASAVLIAFHHVAGKPMSAASGFGSQNLHGWGSHTGGTVTTVLELVALAAAFAAYFRGTSDERRLVVGCTAAVAALIAFGKVFSPQFLIWLIPLAPLVRNRIAQVAFVASLVLTQLYFPRDYWTLVKSFAERETGLLLLRDLAVVALFAVLTWTLARTAPARARAAPIPQASALEAEPAPPS